MFRNRPDVTVRELARSTSSRLKRLSADERFNHIITRQVRTWHTEEPSTMNTYQLIDRILSDIDTLLDSAKTHTPRTRAMLERPLSRAYTSIAHFADLFILVDNPPTPTKEN
jgi:hypothetical protein